MENIFLILIIIYAIITISTLIIYIDIVVDIIRNDDYIKIKDIIFGLLFFISPIYTIFFIFLVITKAIEKIFKKII